MTSSLGKYRGDLMFKQTNVASAVLIVAGIFIASNIYTMLPIQELLVEEFQINLSQTALASFSFIVFYAFGLLIFGMLSDRFGERPILLYGMLSLSILTFLLSFVNHYFIFIAGRAFQGFLAASFAPPAFSYIFRYFHGKTQTISIALINTGFLFAGIFGQILSAYFVFSYSFQTLFYAFSCFYFICFVLLFFALVTNREEGSSSNKQLTSIVSLIRHPPLLKLYITAFFLLFAVMLFYSGFELYLLKSKVEFPLSLQGFRIAGLIGILPAFFANQLVNRFDAKHILIASLLVMTIGFAVSVPVINEWTIMASSILMIASTSLTIPMVIILVGRFSTAKNRGRAISIYSFMLLMGASLGSLLAVVVSLSSILFGVGVLFVGLAVMISRLSKAT
jgi:MFS transporter, YNFM family, putative membrane transport protein